MIELTGAEFNERYQGIKMYKFMNNNLKHYGFQYGVGLNIDTTQFDPFTECRGGLYFCEETKCHMYWRNFGYGEKMASIEIPNDARVCIEHEKFKADRLIITAIDSFEDVCDELWIKILKNDYYALKYIKNQTEGICRYAVDKNSYALLFVINQPDELCKLVLQRHPYNLKLIKNQTEDICMYAVRHFGRALEYVQNQTKEICRAAVEQDGSALQFVKSSLFDNDDDIDFITELNIIAIKQDAYTLQHVRNQTDEICRLAVEQKGLALFYVYTHNKTEELCKIAVQQDGTALTYVPVHLRSEEMCSIAVKQNGCALSFVPNQINDICKRFVENNPNTIESLKGRPERMCQVFIERHARELDINRQMIIRISMLAVNQNGLVLRSVSDQNQTVEMCKIAIQQNPKALQHVNISDHNELQQVYRFAVELNGLALEYIPLKYQTEEICRTAVRQNGEAIKFVIDLNPNITRLFIRDNWLVLKHITNQTYDRCKLAVTSNGLAISLILDPNIANSDEIRTIAVTHNGLALRYIQNQTVELCRLSVEQNGLALLFVKEQTDEICELAVKQNGRALLLVRNQTDEICRLAVEQNPDAGRYIRR